MKKILYLSIIIGAIVFSASCQRQGTIFEIPDDSALVSFGAKTAIVKMLPSDGNKFTVALNRGNTKGAVSVPFTFADESGVFTPSKTTFDFADGEAVAYVDISYPDLNAFGGETYKMTLSVNDEAQLSPSAIDEIEVSAQRQLTYKLLGTGKFVSPVVFEDEWDQDIYNTEESPNYYVLPECYATGYDLTFTVENGVPVFPETFFSGLTASGLQAWFLIKASAIQDGAVVINFDLYLPEYGNYVLVPDATEYFVLPEGVTL